MCDSLDDSELVTAAMLYFTDTGFLNIFDTFTLQIVSRLPGQ